MLLKVSIIILIVFIIIFLWIIYTRIFGAEFVRTPKDVRIQALKMLRLNKKDVFYDLGAGTGTLLIEASPKVKKAIGIEIDPLRFLITYFRIKARKMKNVKLLFGNIFNKKLNDATKIFLFLSKEVNEKIGQKLRKETKKVRVVSYKWPIKNLKIVRESRRYKLFEHKV